MDRWFELHGRPPPALLPGGRQQAGHPVAFQGFRQGLRLAKESNSLAYNMSWIPSIYMQATGVGLLITDPPQTSSTTLSKKRTPDTWHMTHDTWHMTCDTWWELSILSKVQLSSSHGWGVMMFWRIGGNGWVTQLLMTEVFVEQPWLHRVCLIWQPFIQESIRSGIWRRTK